MVMTALRDGASGGILKYFLLGILALAAGGLVFTDMGGFFRGGITNSDVARAGKHNISVVQFDRTLRATLQRFNLTPEQAWNIGYVNEVLKGEMRASLLQQEAQNLGVHVNNEIIAENIQDMLAPMVQPGQRPADVLQQVLRARGMSEQQMAAALRRDMNVNFVSNTIQSGFLPVADLLAKDYALYESEKRNVSYILFEHKDVKDIEKPDETVLLTFYDGVKEAFAKPEMRKVTAVIIDNEKLKQSLDISDEELKDIYERSIDSYKVEETRNIEQLIISDEEQAKAIAEKANNGQSLEAATKDVIGNTTDLIPAKDVRKLELLEELRDTVFEAEEKTLLGPLESVLGYHVIDVKSVKPARTIPFEDVKKDIKAELMETRLLDAQYDLSASVDDYLAAGEDIAIIKEELDVEAQEFPFSTSFGIGEDNKPVFVEAFGPDATSITRDIFDLGEGEATQIIELADGRQVAFIIDEIKPKTYTPFEDVKADLEQRWMNDAKRAANIKSVTAMLESAKAEGTALSALAKTNGKAIQKVNDISRSESAKAQLNKMNILSIYTAPKDSLFAMDLGKGVAIGEVTKIEVTDTFEDEQLSSTKSAIRQEQQKESFDSYVQSLGDRYTTRVNERLLESVYGPESQQ